MKTNSLLLSGIALITLPLVSCNDNNDPEPIDEATVKANLYVLNQGNLYNNIPGALTAINTGNGDVYPDAFSAVNDRSIGDTPQCGVRYGSKIYVGTSASHTIEVINANTLESIKMLSLAENPTWKEPRTMLPHNGKVYITMYEGYVVALDTLSLSITDEVKVGLNPEIMTLHNGKLYVPNSEGSRYPNYGTTASVVDLNSFSVTETIAVPLNPSEFYSAGGNLFLLSKGDYADIPSALYKMNADKSFTLVANCTMAATDGTTIYMVDSPFYSSTMEYRKYNSTTSTLSVWDLTCPGYPSGMTCDKTRNRIYIAEMPYSGEWPSYELNGNLYVYEPGTARPLAEYGIGAGPACIFFDGQYPTK